MYWLIKNSNSIWMTSNFVSQLSTEYFKINRNHLEDFAAWNVPDVMQLISLQKSSFRNENEKESNDPEEHWRFVTELINYQVDDVISSEHIARHLRRRISNKLDIGTLLCGFTHDNNQVKTTTFSPKSSRRWIRIVGKFFQKLFHEKSTKRAQWRCYLLSQAINRHNTHHQRI